MPTAGFPQPKKPSKDYDFDSMSREELVDLLVETLKRNKYYISDAAHSIETLSSENAQLRGLDAAYSKIIEVQQHHIETQKELIEQQADLLYDLNFEQYMNSDPADIADEDAEFEAGYLDDLDDEEDDDLLEHNEDKIAAQSPASDEIKFGEKIEGIDYFSLREDDLGPEWKATIDSVR